MKHTTILETVRTMQNYALAGTTAQAPATATTDAKIYFDREQLGLEKDRLFRQRPVLAGMSADLAGPGDFLTLDLAGVPVLLARGDDGRVRAWLNACTHRGSRLEGKARGRCRRFVCPYHAWSYDTRGQLRSVPGEDSFGSGCGELAGLQRLACLETAGLVFVRCDSGGGDDSMALPAEMEQELKAWDFSGLKTVQSGEYAAACNWKLVVDGFSEGYHFSSVHGGTFADTLNNTMHYKTYGRGDGARHHRLIFAQKAVRDAPIETMTREELLGLVNYVYFFYPNTTLFLYGPYTYTLQVLPHPRDAGRCHTRITLYSRESLDTAEKQAEYEQIFNFVALAVKDEDYPVIESAQKSLEPGLLTRVQLGRNEVALQDFHRHLLEDTGSPG